MSITAAAAVFALALAADLEVPLDSAKPLSLSGAAQAIVIGNPMIAGVTVQNERLLFITGKSYGSTNLIVMGAAGTTLFEGRITVIPDEQDAVFVTRGLATVRLDCTPLCRRRPDLSDDPDAFNTINSLIGARNSAGDSAAAASSEGSSAPAH